MTALQRLTNRDLKALLGWYAANQRELPWRQNPSPYWVWLAEIMSQQTVMAALLPYFYKFIEKFPNVQALARASEAEVLAAWTGLGYYSRARNVQKAAKKIVDDLAGEFPRTYEGWLELPGVGPYTAAAIASQCFGVREPAWDGNVTRVTSRLDARGDVWKGNSFANDMKNALRAKMPGYDASQFNQAFMELGARICTPKSPACHKCPLSSACAAYEKDATDRFPPPKPRKTNVELGARVQVRLRRKRGGYETFIVQRPDSHWFNGMWDFPSELGGAAAPLVKVKSLSKGHEFARLKHQITHHKITLIALAEFTSKANGEGRWIELDDLLGDAPPVPLSTTARKTLKALMAWIADASVQQLCLNMN